jgi:DNA-directed RNA polymerase III subunit RPC1
VPRINEIINATKVISTPIITTTLVNEDEVMSARIVKGRLETTLLGDISKYIKEVYSPKGCYLSIKLDLDVIDKLKLELSIDQIIQSVLKTRKMKLKPDNIKKVSSSEIHIEPYDTSRDKMYFVMQTLKQMLPNVIVKGIPSINRAVINKKQNDESKHELIVEGQGLK